MMMDFIVEYLKLIEFVQWLFQHIAGQLLLFISELSRSVMGGMF
jgi:hypothetical protein